MRWLLLVVLAGCPGTIDPPQQQPRPYQARLAAAPQAVLDDTLVEFRFEGGHLDFELWCLAASAITGCEACVRSHEKVVRDKGGTKELVQDAVRIAAVVHAVALTLATAPPATVSRAA